jgi:hypothetical protein
MPIHKHCEKDAAEDLYPFQQIIGKQYSKHKILSNTGTIAQSYLVDISDYLQNT